MNCILRAAVLFLLFASVIVADEIPVGKKNIIYNLEITNTADFNDYVFLIARHYNYADDQYYDCTFFNEPASCQSTVFALLKKDFNEKDLDFTSLTDYSEKEKKVTEYILQNKSLIKVLDPDCSDLADKEAPYDKIVEKYEIQSISGSTAEVKRTKTLYFDSDNKLIDERSGIDQRFDDRTNSRFIYFSLPFLSLIFLSTIIYIRKRRAK